MLRILITKFWPVLIFLICLGIWLLWLNKNRELPTGKRDIILIIALLLLLLSFIPIIYSVINSHNIGDYSPASYSEGIVNRSTIK